MNDEISVQELFRSLRFYVTPPHPCSYLPDREAISVFLDPHAPISMAHYTCLARMGFRRSGEHIYRPQCEGCDLCIPVRIPVDEFKPSRTQSRCWKHNQDLRVVWREAEYDPLHFDLYMRYMKARHPGGGMDSDNPENYIHIIDASWSNTALLEFRLQQRLMAVAIIDIFNDGYSAVYTYFEPDEPKRSLGVYAILTEIQLARENGLDWLYLGYWNPQSDKMAYKNQYRPLEIYSANNWQRLEK